MSAHFNITGEHLVSSVHRLPSPVACRTSRALWRNVWHKSPIPTVVNGRDLLFIHIPKCAGTSVAHMLGYNGFNHFPAFAFFHTDRPRFKSAISFSVMRNPIDRLRSAVLHLAQSGMATEYEHSLAKALQLSEQNIDVILERVLNSRSLRKRLFASTQAGLSGFTVAQSDWICWNDRVLIDRLFSINRLSELAIWLADLIGQPVEVPHANRSRAGDRYPSPSAALVQLMERHYPRDIELWKRLDDSNGILCQ